VCSAALAIVGEPPIVGVDRLSRGVRFDLQHVQRSLAGAGEAARWGRRFTLAGNHCDYPRGRALCAEPRPFPAVQARSGLGAVGG
jgi:hypothetical protein